MSIEITKNKTDREKDTAPLSIDIIPESPYSGVAIVRIIVIGTQIQENLNQVLKTSSLKKNVTVERRNNGTATSNNSIITHVLSQSFQQSP